LNKTAVITGGIRRLGRQITYFLADSGYDLAIIYNSSSNKELLTTARYLSTTNIEFKFYKCDLKDISQIKKTAAEILKDFKKVDVLVNNSGTIKKIDFVDITPELFDDTFAVNLRAPLFLTQALLKGLNKAKAPVVINLASLGGLQNWTAFMPYSLSKTGMVKLTYLMARRLAPKIRVNAIAPGTIEIAGEKAGTPDMIAMEKIPLKKYGTSKDITSAVKFILECDYLTGHIIPVDGGRMLNN
jgi:NAD(P)-dependent dehydrogenase (short-subunit alcohol dehydrogenase family)